MSFDCGQSEVGSVYSTSRSYFGSRSASGGGRRKTKGLKQKVIGIFHSKNHVNSRLTAGVVEMGKEVPVPSQELRKGEMRSAHQRRTDQVVGLSQKEKIVEETSQAKSTASATYSTESDTDRTVKMKNPTQLLESLLPPPTPLYSNFDLSVLIVALLILFNLSVEIRLKGALVHPGGLGVLWREIWGGTFILKVIARELSTLLVSFLLATACITSVVCTLVDNA